MHDEMKDETKKENILFDDANKFKNDVNFIIKQNYEKQEDKGNIMRLIHVSDTHGGFPELPGEFDVVVCSGDFYKFHQRKPNYSPQSRKEEIDFQTNWLKEILPEFKEWIKGKPFVWCSGNHDFVNPCEFLNQNGVEAIDLDEKVVQYKGFTWYGFPYVRYMIGEWNWEADPKHWKQECQNIATRLKEANALDKLDILVAHSPPYGIVDGTRWDGRIGNPHINPIIDYALQKPLPLSLHGHIHEANGWSRHGETLYVNSATKGGGIPHIISFNNKSKMWEIIE